MAQTKPFGLPGAEPRYARERTYDMTHLRLELALDPRQRSVKGKALLQLTPLHDGFRTLHLDLASEMTVARVQDAKGKLAFEHHNGSLEIDLGRDRLGGRPLEVTIDYSGSPRRGLYFVGPDPHFPDKPYQVWSQGQDEDSRFWFPCYDSPNDKATSEIVATVPKPFEVVSNGQLLGVTENRRDKTRTFHWREGFPHPAYLTSIVVGEFTVVEEKVDQLTLSYHVPPARAESIRRTFGHTAAMMRFFGAAIDYPYPYEKYAQVVVHDFIFGGMENLTATTLTDAILLDATAALDTHSDSIIAHELAHQWWGNLLTCKEWSHAWLNEGFATYFDALFTEHHRGRDEFLWQMHENARDYFQEDEERYRRPIVERRYTKPIEIFDRHLYEKGALVLHMLRHELGDAAFWKTIRHYARKHQFQNVETNDLKVAIEEATGRVMDRFFDQWVYGAGYPVIEASWSWDADANAVRLVVKQTRRGEDGPPVFYFGLDVELAVDGKRSVRRVQVDSAEQVFFLQAASRPKWVRLDPEHRLLLKMQYSPGRDDLLAQLAESDDFLAHIEAAEGLGRHVGDAGVRDALVAALRRPGFFAAKRILAMAIAHLGGDASRDALIRALGEKDLRARRGIARALGEFRGDATASAALRAAFKKEKSYFVRGETLGSLARIAAPDTFEFLAKALELDSFRDVLRATALRGIADLEEERGIDVVLPWARPGHSRWTRDYAMRALASLGRAFPARGRAIQDAFEAALREDNFFTIHAAIDALGKLGRSQAIPALRRVQLADLDGRLQKAAREAIETLTSGGGPTDQQRALKVQVEALQNENREMRSRLEKLEARLGSRALPAPSQRAASGRRNGKRSPRGVTKRSG